MPNRDESEQFLKQMIEKQKLVIDSCIDYTNYSYKNTTMFFPEMEYYFKKEFPELSSEVEKLGIIIYDKLYQVDWKLKTENDEIVLD